MKRRTGLSRDARLLIAGQGVRAAGYGFTAVLLGAMLAARGLTSLQVGAVLTALIAGSAPMYDALYAWCQDQVSSS